MIDLSATVCTQKLKLLDGGEEQGIDQAVGNRITSGHLGYEFRARVRVRTIRQGYEVAVTGKNFIGYGKAGSSRRRGGHG